MSEGEVTRTQMGAGIERLRTHEYTLEVVDGPDKGKTLRTRARVVRIGTSPENEFEVNDGTTSRFHARIEADIFGHRLTDNDSKNGTFVGDLRSRDVYLNPGALLRIGGNTMRYQPGSEAVEIELSRATRFGRIIGQSAAMREIFAILERVALTDMTILVEGESGTGKELVAEAVHQHSKRKDGPLVVFDCSAVAPNLIESELFGHVKGAFTGAVVSRAGAFERAQGGTLFLDEVGELPPALQATLLRVLEDRRVRPVGSEREMPVDVRIVAATNRPLSNDVASGRFRADLYYRLQVVEIRLPALRAHKEDIPDLVAHFIDTLAPRLGVPPIEVTPDEMGYLQQYDWPGNVRELRNLIERSLIVGALNVSALYQSLPRPSPTAVAPPSAGGPTDLHAMEKQHILAVLESVQGDKTQAAVLLGISRRTLERRVAEWAAP